jgi:hypothetical protein
MPKPGKLDPNPALTAAQIEGRSSCGGNQLEE